MASQKPKLGKVGKKSYNFSRFYSRRIENCRFQFYKCHRCAQASTKTHLQGGKTYLQAYYCKAGQHLRQRTSL